MSIKIVNFNSFIVVCNLLMRASNVLKKSFAFEKGQCVKPWKTQHEEDGVVLSGSKDFWENLLCTSRYFLFCNRLSALDDVNGVREWTGIKISLPGKLSTLT